MKHGYTKGKVMKCLSEEVNNCRLDALLLLASNGYVENVKINI